MGIIALTSLIVPIITKMPRPKADALKPTAAYSTAEASKVVN